jgi:DnaJ domain
MHRRARHYAPQTPPSGGPRACDHSGCGELGLYRAPRSRHQLKNYYWFCLEHVREYNSTWDFYRNMSPADIERLNREDLVGQRPTWPLGQRGANSRVQDEGVRTAFRRYFGEEMDDAARRRAREEAKRRTQAQHDPRIEALAVLELPESATLAEIKARYKQLAKKHHPDANGGDKAAEERLKSINLAYSLLKMQRAQA